MELSIQRRVLIVVGLLLVLFGLCVWYGSLGPAPELGAYPDSDDVGATPDPYVGSPVEISGQVVATDPVQIRLEYGADRHRRVTVTGLETTVDPGDELRVFGTLTDAATVEAAAAFTVPPSGFAYTYLVSFAAGVWVLGRIVTGWQFDATDGFSRRPSPRTPLRRLWNKLERKLRTTRETDDA